MQLDLNNYNQLDLNHFYHLDQTLLKEDSLPKKKKKSEFHPNEKKTKAQGPETGSSWKSEVYSVRYPPIRVRCGPVVWSKRNQEKVGRAAWPKRAGWQQGSWADDILSWTQLAMVVTEFLGLFQEFHEQQQYDI